MSGELVGGFFGFLVLIALSSIMAKICHGIIFLLRNKMVIKAIRSVVRVLWGPENFMPSRFPPFPPRPKDSD